MLTACGQVETSTPPINIETNTPTAVISEEIISPTPTDSLPTPQEEEPFFGSIGFTNDACCVGGTAGQMLDIKIILEAESPYGEITQMRIAGIYGGGCLLEADLAIFSWEPFTTEKRFSILLTDDWIGFYVTAQFADQHANPSPIYCADISVEGMPAPTPNE